MCDYFEECEYGEMYRYVGMELWSAGGAIQPYTRDCLDVWSSGDALQVQELGGMKYGGFEAHCKCSDIRRGVNVPAAL